MSQVRLSIPPHVRERYQAAAEAEGMTLCEWCEAALRDALRRYGPPVEYKKDRPKARPRARFRLHTDTIRGNKQDT